MQLGGCQIQCPCTQTQPLLRFCQRPGTQIAFLYGFVTQRPDCQAQASFSHFQRPEIQTTSPSGRSGWISVFGGGGPSGTSLLTGAAALSERSSIYTGCRRREPHEAKAEAMNGNDNSRRRRESMGGKAAAGLRAC